MMRRFLFLAHLDARWLMLAVAMLAGGLAAWAAQHHIRTLAAQIEAGARQPTRQVVVAASDLPAGSRLVFEAVAVRDIPLEWLPAEALLPEAFEAVQGALLEKALRRGEPVLLTYLEQSRPLPFSAQLAAGRRAVTIPVDDINSLSGMLAPGDIIDLYVSFEHQRRRVTAPLLQGVRVLATGRQYGSTEAMDGYTAGFATLTLDASPQEAVKLVAARQQGTISAMLRHAGDDPGPALGASGDLATLLGMADEPAAPPREVPVIFGDRGTPIIPGLNDGSIRSVVEREALQGAFTEIARLLQADDAAAATGAEAPVISRRSGPDKDTP